MLNVQNNLSEIEETLSPLDYFLTLSGAAFQDYVKGQLWDQIPKYMGS